MGPQEVLTETFWPNVLSYRTLACMNYRIWIGFGSQKGVDRNFFASLVAKQAGLVVLLLQAFLRMCEATCRAALPGLIGFYREDEA